MKSILAPVDGAKSSQTVLNAAFLLARQFKAHINILHVLADPKAAIPLLGEGMSGTMIEDMITIAEKDRDNQRQKAYALYKETLQSENAIETVLPIAEDALTAQWTEEEGREDEVIAHHGRLSDLILVPRPTKENEVYSTLALNAALFETGRPMLLLPQTGIAEEAKTISICWNGSMEGARAVAAALPFLVRAEKINIMTAESGSTDTSVGSNLKKYLAWHGVDADSVFFSPAGKSVGEALLHEAKILNSDLMIMGGYSHSRMRELILGGVTRDVIEQADLPVVMGH